MRILGNICLSLAALIYLLPLQLVYHETPKRNDGGGIIWVTLLLLGPLWLLLTATLLITTGQGAFDWLFHTRSPQYLVVSIAGVAMMVVTAFSLFLRYEPASQIPVSTRLLTGWAVQVFPLVTILFTLLCLNENIASAIPALAYRLPMIGVASICLLASGGLLMEWMISMNRRQTARIVEAVAFSNKRDRDCLERVKSIDSTNNFPELLGFANRFENPEIRQLAIAKVESHPEFISQLAEVLQNGWAEKGLVYLDGCDVSPANQEILAEPVRAAIGLLTEAAKDSVARTHTFYPAQFDWNTRIMLSVADKFRGQGVDYAPAIRAYRESLDVPRTRDVQLDARQTLDNWLTKHAT